MRTLLLAAAAALSFACSGAPNAGPIDAGNDAGEPPPPDAGPGDDAGAADAGLPDAGVTCSRLRACSLAWTESAPFPVKVDHHSSMIHTSAAGTFLYVFGGARAEFSEVKEDYANVRRAKVLADGALGAWEDLAPLPHTLSFHGMAFTESRVYLVGGITVKPTGPAVNKETLVGDFAGDGTLTWRTGGTLDRMAIHPTAVILGDRLYVLGGSDSTPVRFTSVSTLGADGLNTFFSSAPDLPTSRSHHVAFAAQGRVFVAGGFGDGNVPIPTILRSVHDTTGKLIDWEPAGVMATPTWTSGVAVVDDAILVVGGGTGGPGEEAFTDRVQRAGLYPDGTVGVFADLTPLPTPRAHVHQAPLFHDTLYSVAGRLSPSLDSMNRVFIGRLSSPPTR